MLVYLLKSGACLGILFLFYKVFLEKENMHVFKRFYLLASLVCALIIPALVFTEYVEVQAPTYTNVQYATTPLEEIKATPPLTAAVLDFAPIFWSIYSIGLLFFGVKFAKNLFEIWKRIRKNLKYKTVRFTQVLLLEKLPPHTFFSYIFLNKQKLEANEIPKEVLLHEETHAEQKHSWDVVFVELLQVIFWVNPFIYLAKQAIKLNHEFLADKAVLQKDINRTTYQNTLLSYLSPASEKKYQPTMANAITNSSYSSIKKRFTVMKKRTSKKAIYVRTLLMLPLMAALLYGFTQTKVIEEFADERENLTIKISSAGILFQEKKVSLFELKSDVKKALINSKENSVAITLVEEVPGGSKVEYLTRFFEHQNIPVQVIKFAESPLSEGTAEGKQILTINITKDGELYINGAPVPYKEADTFIGQALKDGIIVKAEIIIDEKSPKAIVSEMQQILEKHDVPQIDILGPQEAASSLADQEGASKKQITEYNALAKNYNRQLSNKKNIQIYKKDVERLEYLYGLMTQEQKENAEPFPDFPEPPPPPKAAKAPKAAKSPKVKKGSKSDIPPPPPPHAPDFEQEEELMEKQEALMQEQEILMEQQEARLEQEEILIREKAERLEEQEILIQEQDVRMSERSAEIQEIEEEIERSRKGPPTPPTPISPLDHVIAMAKKDAVFYYEGEEISSDKAISIMKKNKDINIDSRATNGSRPVVKLSTAPITIN
ncbi:M56 family metallopeptidase [Maribacter sp.]|nr:M56 family metallopeptidase [Maribacter sp.]